MSPDTSAHGAPVASQEARNLRDSLAFMHVGTTDWPDLDLVIDAYRASERERYAALVEAASEIHPLQATGPDWWRCALCGHKERRLTRDPAAMHKVNCTWLTLRAALAALEEAGSA